MKQITRNEAENLFKQYQVVSSCIEQNREEMRIFLRLANDFAFLVKYNLMDHEKTYFLQEAKV